MTAQEEALSCLIEVAGIHQTFIEGRCGGSNGYRMFVHSDQNQSGNRRGLRFFIMAIFGRTFRMGLWRVYRKALNFAKESNQLLAGAALTCSSVRASCSYA